MEQTLILVDRDDRLLGYADRALCHRGDGKLHRAIAALLFDHDGRILLQRRRSPLWDGIWDLSGATHPLHIGSQDESYQDATARCLAVELGVRASMRPEFSLTYFARYGANCENEYCVLLTGLAEGTPVPNPEYASELTWTDADACLSDMTRHPASFTPWARLALDGLARRRKAAGKRFFD